MLKQFEYKEENRFTESGVSHKFLTVLDEFKHHYTGDMMFYVREEYVTDHLNLPVVEYRTLTSDEYDTCVLANRHDVTKERVRNAKYIREDNLKALDSHLQLARTPNNYPVYVARLRVRDGERMIVTVEDWAAGGEEVQCFTCWEDLHRFRNLYAWEELMNFE